MTVKETSSVLSNTYRPSADTKFALGELAVRVSDVATWGEVRRLALALPGTTEESGRDGVPGWRVKDKGFAWERPLGKSDVKALGATAPDGPILAAYVADLGAKEALLAADPDVYFTTPHFDGYPAVLVRLEEISAAELEELLVEAWLVRAPKRLAAEYCAPPARRSDDYS